MNAPHPSAITPAGLLKFIAILLLLIFLIKIKALFYTGQFIPDHFIKIGVSLLAIFVALFLQQLYRINSFISVGLTQIRIRAVYFASLFFPAYIFILTFSAGSFSMNPWEMALIVLSTTIASSAEEFIFRHFAVNYLKACKISTKQVIFFTSILFALAHFTNTFDKGDLLNVGNQVIFSFFAGIILCTSTILFRSLLPALLIHALVNIPSKLADHPAVGENAATGNTSFIMGFLTTQLVFLPVYILSFLVLKILYKEGKKDQPLKDLPNS